MSQMVNIVVLLHGSIISYFPTHLFSQLFFFLKKIKNKVKKLRRKLIVWLIFSHNNIWLSTECRNLPYPLINVGQQGESKHN